MVFVLLLLDFVACGLSVQVDVLKNSRVCNIFSKLRMYQRVAGFDALRGGVFEERTNVLLVHEATVMNSAEFTMSEQVTFHNFRYHTVNSSFVFYLLK